VILAALSLVRRSLVLAARDLVLQFALFGSRVTGDSGWPLIASSSLYGEPAIIRTSYFLCVVLPARY